MTTHPISIEAIQSIKDNATLLYDKVEIDQAIDVMAQKIIEDFEDLNPILLVIMNGGLIFAGKLIAKLKFPAQIDYCHATRYRGNMSGGKIAWMAQPQLSLEGRHVILIDDILDEGYTLNAIKEKCENMGATSVTTAILVEKRHDRKAIPNMKPDYCELSTPDEYVFGCGMDIENYWRNTESIYIYSQAT